MNREKTMFEKKIKPILQYVGAIGATFMSIVYMVLIFVLIFGFKTQTFMQTLIFAIVNAVMGLIIMQFLKVQGISFAKNLPENIEILQEYYNRKRKEKKYHSIVFYWVKSGIVDILVKGITVCASTCCLIYIVIQGCYDYTLILLAIVNLVMFLCFGLLALNKAYDFFNNEHIPYIKNELKKELSKGDFEKCLKSITNS